MGQKAYKILRSLVSPKKPTEVSLRTWLRRLPVILVLLTPSEIVQRFRFNSRVRKQDETVAAYIAEQRALSEYCNYGDRLASMWRQRSSNPKAVAG